MEFLSIDQPTPLIDHVIIDPARLQPETLKSLAREFILRECGNENTSDLDADGTIPHALTRIMKGELLITFDPETESVGVMDRREHELRSKGK